MTKTGSHRSLLSWIVVLVTTTLGCAGRDSAVDPFSVAIDPDRPSHERTSAQFDLLVDATPSVIMRFGKYLNDDSLPDEIREEIAERLFGRLTYHRDLIFPYMVEACKSDNEKIRMNGAISMGAYARAGDFALIEPLVESPHREVRLGLLYATASMQRKDGDRILRILQHDSDSQIRTIAQNGLKEQEIQSPGEPSAPDSRLGDR